MKRSLTLLFIPLSGWLQSFSVNFQVVFFRFNLDLSLIPKKERLLGSLLLKAVIIFSKFNIFFSLADFHFSLSLLRIFHFLSFLFNN